MAWQTSSKQGRTPLGLDVLVRQGSTRFQGEAGLHGNLQQRYNLLKQKLTGLKRNLTILIKATLTHESFMMLLADHETH